MNTPDIEARTVRVDDTDNVETKLNQPTIEKSDECIINEIKSPNLLDALTHLQQCTNQNTERLLQAFAEKLAYDQTKQQQIDNLHAELQKYRTDLIARTNRPLVNGMIRVHDDIGKLLTSLKKKPIEELTPTKFFKLIENIQDDVEILLDQNGVAAFFEQNNSFEPRRQRVIKHIKTLDRELVGTIAEHLRPGFEQGNDLIQKERVNVYVWDDAEQSSNNPQEIQTSVEDDSSLTQTINNSEAENNNG